MIEEDPPCPPSLCRSCWLTLLPRSRTMTHAEAHPGLAAAERLRRLVPTLAEGDPDAQWLASALARYLGSAPSGLDLDAAVGLATPPGGSPWWRAQADAERDQLLRQLAAEFSGSTHARATQLRARLDRYASIAWLRDRLNKQPRAENVLLFRIYSLDPNPPASVRRLTAIIGE
jgi:hypothetical protein